jgi:hypothetical protein
MNAAADWLGGGNGTSADAAGTQKDAVGR